MMPADWRYHDGQLIHTPPQSPSLHMALDDALTRRVGADRRAPILRIRKWASSAVVIGHFQSLRNQQLPPDVAILLRGLMRQQRTTALKSSQSGSGILVCFVLR